MNSNIEVIQAVKNFSKDIGDPDAIIYNMAGENMPKILRKFCNDIGTKMRVLEVVTLRAKKVELYIGLIKEAVQKDMKDSN